MSKEQYLVSDTHFGHENVWKLFKQPDEVTPLRPFTSTEEMDETMIDNWNKAVRPQDTVYHLGDVLINKKFFHLLSRLNGHKRLIMGNHDIYYGMYDQYFEKIMACRVFKDMILTHIPIKESSIARFGTNVHGHLHSNVENNPNYLCVCVEHTNFTPIHMEEVKKRIEQNHESFKRTGNVIHWQTGKLYKDVYKVGSAYSSPG